MKVKRYADNSLVFYCVACEQPHTIEETDFGFNGDYERPTFDRPIHALTSRVRNRHVTVCNSRVEDGQIEYFPDCTHEYAGKTIELPEMGV